MAVSSAIIDLTDDDDVMHMDGGQVTEETVTSFSWLETITSKQHHTRHHTRITRR